jgi:2-haloacid dehalogenase
MLLVFDLVGTLLSLDAVGAAMRRRRVPETLLEIWFARLLLGATTHSLIDRSASFSELARTTLEQVLASHDLPLELVEPILTSLTELEPEPAAEASLRRLADAGHRLAVLTNSDPEAAEKLVSRHGLHAHFEQVLSVAEARAFKPHPAPYRMALARLGVAPSEACLVAAHAWDVLGAASVGMRTVWIRANEQRWPWPGSPPDLQVADLNEVPDVLPGP